MPDLLFNIEVIMHSKLFFAMRKLWILVVVMLVLGACSSSKPYYKTKEGKKKQKYYNDIQFGGKSASEMKRP